LRLFVPIAVPALALCCAMPSFAQEADGDPLDWSVGLRGTYSMSDGGTSRMGLALTPEASLTWEGRDLTAVLSGGTDLELLADGGARFANVRAGIEAGLQLGPSTALGATLDATLSQDPPDASGLPANTAMAPLVFDATGTASVVQDMGRIDTTLRLEGQRRMVGPTILEDDSTIDNADQSFWQGGAALRLGYEFTPLITLFGEGEAAIRVFDAPDPGLMVYRDARTYTLRGGVSYAWGSIIAAEASAGYAWLDYLSGALDDSPAWVYDASLTFRPDEMLALTASFDTDLGPSASVADGTDLSYSVTGSVTYAANPFLALRGTAGWERTVTLGTGDATSGLSAGAGIDLRTSQNVTWSADYGWTREDKPPAPETDTHSFTVGMRFAR
jgi:hypothetical protein